MAVKIYGSNRIDLDGNNETFSIRASADDELNFYKGASTKLMGIDASGQLERPYLPGFHVSNTSSPVTKTFTGDSTVLHFDYVNRNDGNWNTTSKRYTVPVSGHYFIYCQTRFDGTTTYNRLTISINGNTGGHWQPGIHNITNDATTSYVSLSVSGHLYLNVGDYIEARGGSNYASGSHQGEGSFGAYLIG